MITDFYFEDFIGVFDTEYDTSDLIEYWEYQNKVGATFKRKGLFGKERSLIHTDAADDLLCVDLGGRRIIKKKKKKKNYEKQRIKRTTQQTKETKTI